MLFCHNNKFGGEKLNRAVRSFLSFSIILFILIAFICAVFGKRYETNLFGNQPINITNDVYVTDNDTNITKEVTLPYKLPINYSGKYTIRTTLDKYYNEDTNSIAINLSNMNVDVLVDGNYVYSNRFDDKMTYSKTNGQNLHIVRLFDDYYGKELEIDVKMLLDEGVEYEIEPIVIGSKFDICMKVLSDQSIPFMLVIINVILVSVCLIFIIIFSKNVKDEKIAQLYFTCLFVIIYSCSVFFSMTISNFFVINSYFRYIMLNISNILLCVPIMFMYKFYCGKKMCKIVDFLILITLANFLIQTILNFSHIMDYVSMYIVTFIINHFSILAMFLITIQMIRQKLKVRKSFYFSMIFVLIGALSDISISISRGEKSFIISQISVIAFATIHIIVTGKTLINYYKMGVRSNIYHQMAYTDNMTNMENRLAFDTEISVLENTKNNYQSIWCVVIDINNLKQVNDNLGHQTGDWLISSVAQIINVAFESFGKTYRIGGDEFVIVSVNKSEEEMNEKIDYVRKLTKDANQVCDEFKISVAMGFDKRNIEKDEGIKELFSRVDKLMYENKSYIKSKL